MFRIPELSRFTPGRPARALGHAWPVLLALVTLVLAACNQNGSGPGY